MRSVPLQEIQPRVRIANYHPCSKAQAWMQRKLIDLQFILVVHGELFYQATDEGVTHIQAGEVLCILPTRLHDLWTSDSETHISGIHCELSAGAWASGDYRLDPAPALVTAPRSDQHLHQQFKLCAEMFNAYGNFVAQRCNSICQDILFALAEHWHQDGDMRLSKRMLDMISYIREHLQDNITRQQLASEFFLTPEHINYIFKQELGMTPSEVINRERCLQAHQLLINGVSVKQAAYQVGFNDPLFFSRVFKKYFQVPPSQV